MQCKSARKKFDAYLDGELPATVHEAVRGHLAACERCRDALADHERLRGLLSDAAGRTADAPDGFAQRIMREARRRSVRRVDPVPWSPLQWWKSLAVPMRAAAVLMLVAGLLGGLALDRLARPPSSPVETMAHMDIIDEYGLDYFAEAPDESLAGAYLSLLSEDSAEDR